MTRPLAVVTGTSRGLGAAIASSLLDRGWDVLGIARTRAPAALTRPGYDHVRLDLGDPAGLDRWCRESLAPRLRAADAPRHALVNNAGILGPVRALADTSATDHARVLAVNVAAPLALTATFLRADAGVPLRVIDVSSGAATSPYPGWSAYCGSKAALEMGGRVLATELAEVDALAGRDLAIVSYSPGVVDTAMQAELRLADPEGFPRRGRFAALHAAGELVPPEGPGSEVAALCEQEDLPPWSSVRYAP